MRRTKSRYGLRQAPKFWYGALARHLKELEVSEEASSECLFRMQKYKRKAAILAYVDDFAIIRDVLSLEAPKSGRPHGGIVLLRLPGLQTRVLAKYATKSYQVLAIQVKPGLNVP